MNFDTILILTVAAITLSGFVQSVTGFGFGLVSMALLPLVFKGFDKPFDRAYVIVTTMNVVVCAVTFATICRHYRWRQGLMLVLGSCIAVPVGFYIMTRLNQNWLMRGLGLLIVVFAASELIMGKRRPLRLPENTGMPMGLLSGGLSGAFNMGGPPAVAYVYSQSWSKEHIIALLQVVFGTSSVIRLFLVKTTGMLEANLLRVAAFAILPLLAAIFGGTWLVKKINREQLRLIVFVLLLVIGIKYTFRL